MLVWVPTLRLAVVRALPAAAGVNPTTLGTVADVCWPETVKLTTVVEGTSALPAGYWASTVPAGLLLVT